jgi:hypothetical protein
VTEEINKEEIAMSRHALIPLHGMFALTFLASFVFSAAAATDARLSESYGKLPLHFEANRGQTDKDVRFLSRGPGYSLYLTANEAVLVLAKPDAKAQGSSLALRMSLVGAARKPVVSGLDAQAGKANYFIGKDPAKWRTNVPTYAKVHYRDVYPGIDLVYYGNQRQLEYDFVVAPDADPKKIVLAFKGADKLEINSQGELVLHAAGGEILQRKPVIYQETDGVRQEIAGRYVRKGANRVGFEVAAYDTSRPLVIDPIVLSYSTFLGACCSGTGITVDADGNAYITGTASSNLPTTAGAFQSTPRDSNDAFVAKFDPTGSTLVYSTYLGGSGRDSSNGIAVDASGNAYVTGSTGSSDFPTTLGAFQPLFGGGSTFQAEFRASDAFVTKLNATGSALIYSTYLGGFDDDGTTGIAVDAAGNAYVGGRTSCAQTSSTPTTRCENNFPTTPGAFNTTFTATSFVSGFVTKLNAAGSALVYSTYMGAGVNAIALDTDGNAYLASFFVQPTPGAFQTIPGDSSFADAGVTKLNTAGSALVYSTFLGGSGNESGSGIAVDAAGSAYLTGHTTSPDFPTTPGAFQQTYGGSDSRPVFDGDAFVAKFNPTGSALVYSTYLGGSSEDQGSGIAVDSAGNAWVTGSTFSTNFPTTADAFRTTAARTTSPGSWDGFMTLLNPDGSRLVYSTYMGAFVNAIAVDTAGNAYVTGSAPSNFPTTPGAYQTTGPGAFVAKFGGGVPPAPATTRFEESAATYTGAWTTYGPETGTFSGGTVVASNQTAASATFAFTGTAVSWIGVKCNTCGIASVSIDGGAPAIVDTFGPGATGSLNSESVFSVSGLAPGVTHTLVITVTGTGTAVPWSLTGSSHVAVDAFDVTR